MNKSEAYAQLAEHLSTAPKKLSTELGNDFIADVMHRFYQQISKEHEVYTDRIMLAITDNGRFFQAYVTNEKETELRYLQDYAIPNGA